jgi:hypothetical protein
MHGAISPPPPQYIFREWCLVKRRDGVTVLSIMGQMIWNKVPGIKLNELTT